MISGLTVHPVEWISIFDSEYLYSYSKGVEDKSITKINLKTLVEKYGWELPLIILLKDLRYPFNSYIEDELKYRKIERTDFGLAYVFQGKKKIYKNTTQSWILKDAEIWIDLDSGLLIKEIIFDKGKECMSIIVNNLDVSPNFSKDEFEIQLPKGRGIEDQTNYWVQIFNKLQ
jgi:outer membrane lipoprotein-sorting protein